MSNQDILALADAYIEEVWPQVVNDIANLVAMPSVADSSRAEPGSPFGPEAHEALKLGLSICERLGLDAHDCDGMIGYADLAGASPRQIATIAHIDVVPAGTGWTDDPFTLRRREGYLLGRGVADDKGPAVLSMYAAHFFARRGEELPCTLRVILGSDEEVGMHDVDYYLEHFEAPSFLFTPDGAFPVCCGEKGRVLGKFSSAELSGGSIVSFDGGTVPNAIPSLAQCVLKTSRDVPVCEGIEVEALGEGCVKVVAHGKGGHASLPAGTVNAIDRLVSFLLQNNLVTGGEREFLEFLGCVFASTDGSSLGIDATDDLFDPLTAIGGTLRLEGNRLVQTIDIRYPTSITGEFISQKLSKIAREAGMGFETMDSMPPFRMDPQNPRVQTLCNAYSEVTGRDALPYTTGGGTYARHFPTAVCFGPEEHDETPEWVGKIHSADEGVSEEELKRALKVYIVAIAGLMELEGAVEK